jgi:arylsulfatase
VRRLSENSVVNIKNTSHAVTAEIVVPSNGARGAQGVIIAQGGSIGGWSLYVKDGRLRHCHNLLGVQRFYVDSDREIPGYPPGAHGVRLRRARARQGRHAVPRRRTGGCGTVAATAAMVFSADDTWDVGKEDGALVAEDSPVPDAFTGEVNWVEGRRRRGPPAPSGRAARVAMARQWARTTDDALAELFVSALRHGGREVLGA